MSMWLILAKIEPGLLDAVRADPDLLASVLGEDNGSLPPGFNADSDLFEADYLTLSAIAEVNPSKEWFDKATGGTESLDFDDFTYGSAFALSPRDVSEVASGLVAEGWYAGGPFTMQPDESEEAVQRSARALGEAAEWDPDELENYGPMMAATGSSAFNARVIQAIGAIAGWEADTLARVSAAVAEAEPEELSVDEDADLATFFLTAAAEGRAVVGGIN